MDAWWQLTKEADEVKKKSYKAYELYEAAAVEKSEQTDKRRREYEQLRDDHWALLTKRANLGATGNLGVWDKKAGQEYLERFVKALPAVKADILDPKPGSVIQLEDGAFWLGDKSVASDCLFIRDCYPELLSTREAFVKRCRWTHSETVFTGMPGVGKSHLGALCVAHALLQGRNVVLERLEGTAELQQRHWYWLSLKSGCVEHTTDEKVATKKLQQNTEHSLYVADGCPQGIPKEFGLGESLTFCSPQEQLWRYYNKGAKVLILTVPAVSLPELQSMRDLIPDYQELDESLVRERFFWAGGSARACLKDANHDSDEPECWESHIKLLLQKASTTSWLDVLYSMEYASCIPDHIDHIFHWDCLDDLPVANIDSSEDLRLHKYREPCIRFASMRVRDLAIMVLDLTKLANIAMACLNISDSQSSTVYWWEILTLRFLQMGQQKLHAALLPDKGHKCTNVLLNVPEAAISWFSTPQEAAERCKSDMPVLLISHWETSSIVDFMSDPVLWWQLAKAKAENLVTTVLTAMSTAMANVDGGRKAQFQASRPMDLKLPVLCVALPPRCFDLLYGNKRPSTEPRQSRKCQENVVHQLAVKIPLEEILKTCPYRFDVGMFKMDVEQLHFPEGVFTEACMEDDADYREWRRREDMSASLEHR